VCIGDGDGVKEIGVRVVVVAAADEGSMSIA
jgi:hypothetical protein